MLDNACFVKLAMVDGSTFRCISVCYSCSRQGWQCFVDTFLEQHFQHISDIASVVDREKPWVAFMYLYGDSDSSLVLDRTPQPEYHFACYLAEVRCLHLEVVEQFRSGCHGLQLT